LPLIQYFLIVGSILFAGIWWINHDTTATTVPHDRPMPKEWTQLDSLRAIAHHGDRDARSAAIFPRQTIPELPLEASAKPATNSQATLASTAITDARAEGVRSKKMANVKIREASAVHRKHFAQRRRPAKTRIAADDHPAPAFFGFPILR
jgi:hypothetical protein